MGNHHFYWVNPRTKKWPCSIANCNKLPEVMYDDPRFKALTPLGTSLFFLSRRLPGTPLLLTVTSDWNHVSMWIFHIHTYIHIYIYGTKKKLTYIYIYPYHREYADISHWYPIDILWYTWISTKYIPKYIPNICPFWCHTSLLIFFSQCGMATIRHVAARKGMFKKVCQSIYIYMHVCTYIYIYIGKYPCR